MSWDPIERRFREIGVPVRFADRGWFAVDVDRTGGRERITLSPGDAELHVMDVDPEHRQLLLQVRRGPDWAGRPTPARKVLVGHDERQLFTVDVPGWRRPVNTVAAAHDALKPEAVREAERYGRAGRRRRGGPRRPRGARVLRQGDWFFLPCPWIEAPYGNRQRVRLGGRNPHVIAELLGNPNDLGARGDPWRFGPPNPVFARGFVRHREHKPLNLRCWHRILHNTAGRVEGNYAD
jgi:hypothetical protein